nr:dockerin type I domain-containing protein [Pirellulaceae bacterium]
LKADKVYQLLVAVNGTTVTVVLGNKTLSHTFAARIIDGMPVGLNKGFVGAGSDNARGTWDNFAVQVLPPQLTLDETEDFNDGAANRFTGDASGAPWAVSSGRYAATAAAGATSVQTVDLGIDSFQANSYLELQATLKTNAVGGLVFDEQTPDRYKFVALDIAAQKVLLGHVEPNRGWVIDTSVAKTLKANTDYTLGLTLRGASVSVTINGVFAISWGFNAPVVDGAVGVLTQNGTTSFDVVRIRTNDPAFTTGGTVAAAAAPSMLAISDTSPVARPDVNGDGKVTPADALILINALNQPKSGSSLLLTTGQPQYDVDGDNVLSPSDVLIVINELNAAADGAGLAEGEGRLALATAPVTTVGPVLAGGTLATQAHDAVWGDPQSPKQLVLDAQLDQSLSEGLMDSLAQTAVQRKRDAHVLGDLDPRTSDVDDALTALLCDA